MILRILVPSQVFAEVKDVTHLVVATTEGSWGMLPHRRDCVAALVPGVLMFETPAGGVSYVAVDRGVLIKTQAVVQISVRRAVSGPDLGRLRDIVAGEYAVVSQSERDIGHLSEKLENGFIRRMVALHHE